MGTGQGFQPV